MKAQTKNLKLPNLFTAFLLCFLCLFVANTHAGGSWLVDGQAVQTLEVQTTNADPNALYTDGTRTMQAPLAFDTSVTSLFRAYTPWDGMYDFFVLDENLEAVKLCNGSVGFYPTSDLYIFGTTLGDDSGGGGRVDIGEMTLKGGYWQVDTVGPYDESIITRGFGNSTYIQRTEGITVNHTIQAGDVLQIQNGIITAINP